MTLKEVNLNKKLVNDYVGKLVVYKITNLINNKSYIGITSRIKRRIYEHNLYSSNNHKLNKYIHKSISKYGTENFSFEILDIASNNDELNSKEESYIKKYNSSNDAFGYNLTNGGRRGIPNDITLLRKIESSHKQKVAKYGLDGKLIEWFESVSESHRQTGIPITQINRSHRKNWTTGGFIFKKFDEEPLQFISPFKSKRGINFSIKGKSAINGIRCELIDKKTNQIIAAADSIAKLAEKAKLDKGTIFRAIKNKNHKKWKVIKHENRLYKNFANTVNS